MELYISTQIALHIYLPPNLYVEKKGLIEPIHPPIKESYTFKVQSSKTSAGL